MELGGKHVIVTGATGGIGQATVRTLIAGGVSRVGLVGRTAKTLNVLVEQLAEEFGEDKILGLHADVTDADAMERAFATFDQVAEPLDVLVNNAGILAEGPIFGISFKGIQRFPFERWQQVLDTNLTAAFVCAQLAIERMVRKRVRGVVVNVSSHSRRGRVAQSAYSASKGGLDSLTYTLARELRSFGIRCCAVAPGLTRTGLLKDIAEAHIEQATKEICVGRPGHPEEIAHGIRFCIENDFFNGRVLELDGGTFG